MRAAEASFDDPRVSTATRATTGKVMRPRGPRVPREAMVAEEHEVRVEAAGAGAEDVTGFRVSPVNERVGRPAKEPAPERLALTAEVDERMSGPPSNRRAPLSDKPPCAASRGEAARAAEEVLRGEAVSGASACSARRPRSADGGCSERPPAAGVEPGERPESGTPMRTRKQPPCRGRRTPVPVFLMRRRPCGRTPGAAGGCTAHGGTACRG